MLLTKKLAGLRFKHRNVIDFQIVRHTAMETEKTLVENIVDWLKNDLDDGWYKHLQTTALILILKYIMLIMGMLADNLYKLTFLVMIRSVFIFKIEDIKSESKKYELICHLGQKLLLLKDLVPYMYIDNKKNGKAVDAKIPEREVKSSLTLFLSQLHSDVYTAKSLCIALVEPPKSWFATSLDLFDIEYIYHYACTIISIEKDIYFSLGPHHLNTFFPPVFAFKVVDKLDCCNSRLLLEQAIAFHTTCMEQEIARLNIIVS